jgi:hypothetical protein
VMGSSSEALFRLSCRSRRSLLSLLTRSIPHWKGDVARILAERAAG